MSSLIWRDIAVPILLLILWTQTNSLYKFMCYTYGTRNPCILSHPPSIIFWKEIVVRWKRYARLVKNSMIDRWKQYDRKGNSKQCDSLIFNVVLHHLTQEICDSSSQDCTSTYITYFLLCRTVFIGFITLTEHSDSSYFILQHHWML